VLYQRTAHFFFPHWTDVHNHGQLVQGSRSKVQENARAYPDITTIRSPIFKKHDLQFRRSFLDGIPKLLKLFARCTV
jgi:hypothetical protein